MVDIKSLHALEYQARLLDVRAAILRKAQEERTGYYIWRTRGDGNVRPSHAANDGRIFSWDNPPATGHPGEDYGCRCVAEPYIDPDVENIYDPAIDPEYPIESLLGLAIGGAAFLRLLSTLMHRIRDVDAGTLTVAQARNLKRFSRKVPKDAQEIKILRGTGGNRIFRADVPAKNIPGSYARYEKVVDKHGNTISYTKTTFAPDGRIVHIKPK